MKTDIQPTYYPEAKITCACGAAFTTGSTRETIRVELCSQCHPFYTGKQKFVDTARRVEKFQEKATKTAGKKSAHANKKTKRATRAAKKIALESPSAEKPTRLSDTEA